MQINPPHKKRKPPPESGTEVARNSCCRPPGPASAPYNVRVKDYSTALSQALIRRDLFNPWASLDVSGQQLLDRKSTRLNSSHLGISYAVFCLKKKRITQHN